MMANRRSARLGFTLVEVLVALLIASLVAILSFRGIDALINAERHLDAQSSRWLDVHRFLSTLEMDLRLALPRAGRDAGGTLQPALVGLPAAERPFGAQLSLMQSDDGPGASVRRVAYRLKEDRIDILHWPAAHLPPYGDPRVVTALAGVRSFSLRYFGADNVWHDAWMPADPNALPQGISIRLEMIDPMFAGPIERVVSR